MLDSATSCLFEQWMLVFDIQHNDERTRGGVVGRSKLQEGRLGIVSFVFDAIRTEAEISRIGPKDLAGNVNRTLAITGEQGKVNFPVALWTSTPVEVDRRSLLNAALPNDSHRNANTALGDTIGARDR